MTLKIESVTELSEAVRDTESVLVPTGSGTKLNTSALSSDSVITLCDVSHCTGIVTYEASEFLISAKAGTTLSEVATTLATNAQYLPFDPILVERQATLGGTVASGISGPSSLLYGSLRDFVMEVQLVTGDCQPIRAGGKVVKNAAGFDIPKLMVGSCGRLGIMTEITLKVFPQPQASASLIVEMESVEASIRLSQQLQRQPLPISALDIEVDNNEIRLLVRFSGPAQSLRDVVDRAQTLSASKANCSTLTGGEDTELWQERRELVSNQAQSVRIPVDPTQVIGLDKVASEVGIVSRIYSRGGSVAWLNLDLEVLATLSQELTRLGLSGTVLPLPVPNPYVGDFAWQPLARRIQTSLDPDGKYIAW